MFRNSKRPYIIVGALLIAVVGLSIAYAALSTQLNINYGTVTQNVLNWSVGFRTTPSSVSATAYGTSATGRSCGNATVTRTSVTIGATQLSKPGDKCEWELVIENTGDIDAYLSTLTLTYPTSVSCTKNNGTMVCGNITYTLARGKNQLFGYSLFQPGRRPGSSSPGTGGMGEYITPQNGEGEVLSHGTSFTAYLVAEFTGSEPSDSSVVQSGANFTLTYEQY